MPELTSAQIAILKRLIERGFAPAAFPLYPSSIGIRRGMFAALLEVARDGGLRKLGEPYFLLDGNLSVCVEAEGRRWFVWKSRRVEATAELLEERKRFAGELTELLPPEA